VPPFRRSPTLRCFPAESEIRIHARWYTIFSPCATQSHDTYLKAKWRKVRKGTHSYWECKRKKIKCIFDPRIASTSCNGCRRRGSQCISQEFVEDVSYVAHSGNDGPSPGAPTSIVTPGEEERRVGNNFLTPVTVLYQKTIAFHNLQSHWYGPP
jgi:hypothetical protein